MKGEKFSENQTKGREIWVECEQCSGATKHTVEASLELQTPDSYETDDGVEHPIEWLSHFQIIKCGGCEWLSFPCLPT